MLKKTIAFIGPGVIAEAMIAGLLRQKLADPKNIIASGPREERGEELRRKYGIKITTDVCIWASLAASPSDWSCKPSKALHHFMKARASLD